MMSGRLPLPLTWPAVRKIDVQNFQRATRDTPREVNRRIILALMRERGPISRAELARSMNVPRGMITSLVNELLGEGLIFEGATAEAPRGRKPVLLHLESRGRLAVGVDVRASRTTLRVSDFAGECLAEESFPTPDDPGDLVEELHVRILRLVGVHGSHGEFEGVGVVVPGMVDGRTGRVLNAPTLGWRDVDIREDLSRRVGLPVHMERDAVACALARMWMGDGAGDRYRDFVYLIVSEGVGIGVVVNGQPMRGRNFTAGEFGHVPLDLEGPVCSCGARGCLEAFTCDAATVARYEELRKARHDGTCLPRGEELTLGEIVARAESGDSCAREAVRVTGRYVGVGVAAIINALNPARVVLGGDITAAWDVLEPEVRAQIRERALTEAAAATPLQVDPDYAGTRLRGAAALVVAPAFAAPQIA